MIVYTSQDNLEKSMEMYGDKKGVVIKVIDKPSSGDKVKKMANMYVGLLS